LKHVTLIKSKYLSKNKLFQMNNLHTIYTDNSIQSVLEHKQTMTSHILFISFKNFGLIQAQLNHLKVKQL